MKHVQISEFINPLKKRIEALEEAVFKNKIKLVDCEPPPKAE